MKMMKFNQFVRASVLSITLAGGLAFTSNALAYNANDLYEAQNQLSTAEANLNAALAGYQNAYYTYMDNQNAIESEYQAMSNPCMDGPCWDQAWDWYTNAVAENEAEYASAGGDVDAAQWAYDAAWDSYEFISAHQNGIQGQP
jgi:hypothetical protein